MWKKVTGHASAFFLGLFIGFFFVIAPLFSSGPWAEYIISLILVFIFFSVTGAILGAILPESLTFVTLSVPSIVMVLMLGVLDQPNSGKYIALFLIYPVIVILSSFIGERIGSWIHRWKNRDRSLMMD
jgi:hypothetical protein